MVVWLKQAKTDIWKLSFQSHISFYPILNTLSSLPQAYICGRGLFKTLQALIFCSDQTPFPSHPLFKIWNWRLSSTKGGGGGRDWNCVTLFYFLPFFSEIWSSIFVLFSFNIQGTNWESYISAAENSICHLTFYVSLSPSYLCDVCSKIVAKNYKAVCCNKSNMWVHMVCNNQSKYCCRKLQNDNFPWFCLNCLGKEMSFSNLSNNQFKTFMSGKTILLPCLVEENQNDQINPQEFSVAI